MLRAAVAVSGATALIAGAISAAVWICDRQAAPMALVGPTETGAPGPTSPAVLAAAPAVLATPAVLAATPATTPARPAAVTQPRYSGLFDPGLSGTAAPAALEHVRLSPNCFTPKKTSSLNGVKSQSDSLCSDAALTRNALLGSSFEPPAMVVSDAAPPSGNVEAAAPTPAATILADAEAGAQPTSIVAVAPELEAPLPLPRPANLGASASEAPWRAVGRQIERPAKTPVTATGPADTRNFIQTLFGIPQSLKSVLAYAAPEDEQIGGGRIGIASPLWTSDRMTAVYNISAHTVTLPNGTVLEAHSGLGNRLDDPRYVSEPNRGATPPHAYDLEPRAQLFHGVQALRLNPVGGGGVFGRTGLLAHTFMLGPNGDSNGCVSFKNYNAFLQAYLKGEVKRLVVVAGRF